MPPLVELGEKDISDGFSSDVQPPEDIEQVRDRSALSPIFERDPQTQVSIFQPTDLDELVETIYMYSGTCYEQPPL